MSVKQRVSGLVIVSVLLLVLLNLSPVVHSRLAGEVRDVLMPVTAFLSKTFAFRHRSPPDSSNLMADNNQMAVEIGRLQNKIRQLKSLERENTELRRLLGLEARSGFSLLAAQVMARAIGGWWEMARLDKGSFHGVSRDWPVISAEGLVGRIVDVSAYTSDVMFLVDPNSKVSGRLSRMDAFGIVRGQGVSLSGDPLCRMDFIMKDADLLPGDEVVTSGLGGVYPAGLVIGYVANVYRDRSGLYQYADVVPAADLRSLEFVFIVPQNQSSGQRKTPSAGKSKERRR